MADDVGSGMPIVASGCISYRMTSGVTCYLLPWAADTIGLRQAWHARMFLGHHTWLDDVEHPMASSTLGTTLSDDVGRGMPLSLLGSTHGRMKLGVACYYSPWKAYTVERCRAWHVIIALGLHTRLDDVRNGMPAWSL